MRETISRVLQTLTDHIVIVAAVAPNQTSGPRIHIHITNGCGFSEHVKMYLSEAPKGVLRILSLEHLFMKSENEMNI